MNTSKSSSHAISKGQSQGNKMSKERVVNKTNGQKSSTRKTAQNGNADKTKDELLEMAKKLDIPGRHDMTKDELVKAIDKHNKK